MPADSDISIAVAYGVGYSYGSRQNAGAAIQVSAEQIAAINKAHAAGREAAYPQLPISTEATPPLPDPTPAPAAATPEPAVATPEPAVAAPEPAAAKPQTIQNKLETLEQDLEIESPPKSLLSRLKLIEKSVHGPDYVGKGSVKKRVEAVWSEMY